MNNVYLIAIMLEGEAKEQLSAIQEHYRMSYWKKRIGPHITLIRPFVTTTSINNLKRIINEISDRSTFELTLKGVDTFQNEKAVIFANVEPSTQLDKLHTDLLSALTPYIDLQGNTFSGFHPHVTLSNKLEEQDFSVQFEDMKKLKIDIAFRCVEYTLLKLSRKNEWKPVHHFKF